MYLIAHKWGPLGFGDEMAGEPHGADKRAMRRRFIIEAEAVVLAPHRMNAFGQFTPVIARRGALRPAPIGIIDRRRRVFRESVHNVGQHQFLMLLLVMKADL